MAEEIHLFPYRTQKLSLLTPMVLGGRPPGRLGSCQTYKISSILINRGYLYKIFLFIVLR